MAILIRGKTTCPLCHRVIGDGDAVTMFPAFVTNELDALTLFDDAAFHTECFVAHPLAPEAVRRYEEYQSGARNMSCAVCGEPILEPTDYVAIGHLSSDPEEALHEFNYLRFHRAHLYRWANRDVLYRELSRRVEDGTLRSRSYRLLLEALAH